MRRQTRKNLSNCPSATAMITWHASTDTPPPTKRITGRYENLTYLSSGLVVSLCRRDLISALVSAGCHHLAVKIFQYLDSASLLASSLVCVQWQSLLLSSIYTTPKFRNRVRSAIFGGCANKSQIVLSLDNAAAAVLDIAVDDDFNIFTLGVLDGRPHVMVCSLFGLGKKRWVHRIGESLNGSNLTCISAGHSMVALGCKDGRIFLYECNHQFRLLRPSSALLTHHTAAIRAIVFAPDSPYIVSCSDDMNIGVVSIRRDGSLQLTKLLHGHVSRVRAINVQNGRILSGSDDRSVKLWSLKTKTPLHKNGGCGEKPLNTMTGHSGPVTGVQLCLPFALSSSGSTVRLWDVLQGTCLKLLQHQEEWPVTTMTWISTFKGVATVDASGQMRCFDLHDLETTNQEIMAATCMMRIIGGDSDSDSGVSSVSSTPTTPPRAGTQRYSGLETCSSSSSSNPDSSIFKLESIPHHFSAFSITNCPLPTVTVHCLDYVV